MNVSVENQIGEKIWVPFFSKTIKSEFISLSRILPMLESKEIRLWFEKSSFELFLYNGTILLVSKVEGNNPEEKDWLNRNISWSDISLFNNFKILVGILFCPSHLSWFKEEIILETSVLSRVIKNDSIFKSRS